MRLEEQVVTWLPAADQPADLLFRYRYSTTDVFVADTELAAKAVCSRHLCGTEKQQLFRQAVGDVWQHCGSHILGNDWPGEIVECVILRGADHVRPENPGALIGRQMARTAIRLHRSEVSPGNWAARVVEGESENTKLLFRSNKVVVWDGCSASGSTLKSILWLLRQKNPTISRVLIVCPFMGGLALRRAADQARELAICLSVLCFGVYRVAPIGWEDKTETDIYIPSDSIIGPSHTLAIPERQVNAHREFYQPREVSLEGVNINDDGFCLVGDVGQSMAAVGRDGAVMVAQMREQLEYVLSTMRAWPVFCQSKIPVELQEAKRH
ncbi:MAG: hypothetical protein HY980_00675 [Candidatus Magasanikbacteria bacterium]|nr:hypothetical protein [Candidatus Magasanikbacteria bacterium]